jgi:hypothetical protein
MEHSLLSPSAAHKWMNCPPSARLEEKIKKERVGEKSIYADEGRLAHEIANAYLSAKFNKIDGETFGALIKEAKKSALYDAEMEYYAKRFAEFLSFTATAREHAFSAFEIRLDYSAWVPDGFGTSDAVIIADDELTVADYKYGKGVAVSAADNPQLALYALGAYETFKEVYDVKNISLIIYQPRIYGDRFEAPDVTAENFSELPISASVISIEDLLTFAENKALPAGLSARDGTGAARAGIHCRFCFARGACKAYARSFLERKAKGLRTPELYEPGELAEILPVIEELSGWATSVEDYVRTKAISGVKFPGYKLVEGRSARRYADENKVKAALLLETELKADEFAPRQLLGITAMEKLLGKKGFKEILGKYIEKPAGKPTLVKDSDPRAEYDSALADFAEVVVDC